GKKLPALIDLEPSDAVKQMGHVGLVEYFKTKFEPIKLRSRTFDTKRLYRITLKKFATFLSRPPVLADLNNDTVGEYLGWVKTQHGNCVDTAAKERSNILAIWRFACRRGDLKVWPEVEQETIPD